MSEGQERETGEGGLENAGDEGLLSWVGGPSVLRKGRFDVIINSVCKGGIKAVGGFFRIVAPGVSVRVLVLRIWRVTVYDVGQQCFNKAQLTPAFTVC